MIKGKKAKTKEKGVMGRPKVKRFCHAEGCGKEILGYIPKKYCNSVCKNKHSLTGDSLVNVNSNEIDNRGRPTKYRPEFSGEMFEKYIESCKASDQREFMPTGKDGTGVLVINNARLLTVEGYAEFIGVDDGTFPYWSEKYPEFASVIKRILRIQKDQLLNNGLSGQYSSVIAKLALMNNHDMKEKTETNNTHKFMGIMKHIYEKADELDKLNENESNR